MTPSPYEWLWRSRSFACCPVYSWGSPTGYFPFSVVSGQRKFGGVEKMKDRLMLPGIGLVSVLVLLGVSFVLLGGQAQVERDYDLSGLPALNAFLNGTSAVLLTIGYLFIRRKR